MPHPKKVPKQNIAFNPSFRPGVTRDKERSYFLSDLIGILGPLLRPCSSYSLAAQAAQPLLTLCSGLFHGREWLIVVGGRSSEFG
jgi:hypothetical protein